MNDHSILVFHGSPLEMANNQILELVDRLNLPESQSRRVAFLEFAKPDLHTVLRSFAEEDTALVTIFPIFLFVLFVNNLRQFCVQLRLKEIIILTILTQKIKLLHRILHKSHLLLVVQMIVMLININNNNKLQSIFPHLIV